MMPKAMICAHKPDGKFSKFQLPNTPNCGANRKASTMSVPRMPPNTPSTVIMGIFPSLYFAPGEASYNSLARYGSSAPAMQVMTNT